MSDCLFCNIASGQIPAKIVFQDDNVVAFEDINPQSPVHIVIIPRKHIPTVFDITQSDLDIMGYLYLVTGKIAADMSIDDGFRLVVNCGHPDRKP
jgi:histidine triad (HIT) family protein